MDWILFKDIPQEWKNGVQAVQFYKPKPDIGECNRYPVGIFSPVDNCFVFPCDTSVDVYNTEWIDEGDVFIVFEGSGFTHARAINPPKST